MEVILLKEIPSLGYPGTIVNVKNGYARNFLFPKKFAVRKGPKSLEILAKQKEEFDKIKEVQSKGYQDTLDKINKVGSLSIKVKTGANDKLFGSITNHLVADELKSQFQIDLDKRSIIIKDTIKILGSYNVIISLNKENKAELVINVESSNTIKSKS